MKKQFNVSLVKPTEKAEEVPPVCRKTVEENLQILTFRSDRIIRGSFRMFPESLYFYTKQYNHFRYISFKIDPLCNNPLLPATVKVLETFLEGIFESLFSSSVAFMTSTVSQKRRSFNADFSRGKR